MHMAINHGGNTFDIMDMRIFINCDNGSGDQVKGVKVFMMRLSQEEGLIYEPIFLKQGGREGNESYFIFKPYRTQNY